MEEFGGWLWALIGLGVVALAVAIAYGNALWRRRRKDWAARHARDEATREIYRKGR